MASIRRTLSPAANNCHDRSSSQFQSQFQIQIQSQRSFSSSSSSSTLSSSSSHFHRLLLSVMGLLFFHKPSPPRKCAPHHNHNHNHNQSHCNWNLKRSLLRFFLFFLLGFLLGLSPFANLQDAADLKPHHFFFDSIATTNPNTNVFNNININPHHRNRNLGALVRPEMEMVSSSSSAVTVKERERKKNNFDDSDHVSVPSTPIPTTPSPKLLIIVTPTYNRALQAYYLSRLGQTLRLVPPPLLWVVVEMKSASMETADILRKTGVMYRHLVCRHNSTNIKDRGVHQRNTALDHIQRHLLDGIVYFADDDNIYSLHLFHHLRNIRRFGTWPVAMLAQSKNKATLEGPVCNGSQVMGWHTNEKSKRLRRFHVDMSGFAFNSTIFWDPKRWRRLTSDAIRQLDTIKEGFQETTFIEQVVEDEYQMEGIPHDCSKVMNWHLHLEAGHLFYPNGWKVSQNLDVVSSL